MARAMRVGALLGMLGIFAAAVQAQPPPASTNDLDAFMARVLERRDENWKKLHDYILSETESFAITGPGNVRLQGLHREFTWYVREGFLIRSPLKMNGVSVPEPERRRYEEDWLKAEKQRAAKKKKDAAGAPAPAEEPPPVAAADVPSLEAFVAERGEPRFVSEAYFLKFRFEPGNYYLVGRDRIDGQDVLQIEYYPTRLFGGEDRASQKPAAKDPRRDREQQVEDEMERKFNKVARVTLWIEPSECQIVRYTFENVDFGFLPGRWLVRVGQVIATMTMGRVLGGVWLPRSIAMHADLTVAAGTFGFMYSREFYDHKRAEVSARIREVR